MIDLNSKAQSILESPESQTQEEGRYAFLDWRKRPSEINQEITRAFHVVNQCSSNGWLYNGESEYRMLRIPEHTLIKKMIQQDSLKKRNFYVLEIGAGNFQWGRSLEQFINEQQDIPEDVTVHIIGVVGESALERREDIGKCRIYELTAFKIENLFKEFQKRGFLLENQLDFIISRWCFRHLVDPLGTFIQAYNLLRPHAGLLVMDGFYFFDKDDTWENFISRERGKGNINANIYLINLLVRTKAPFLLQTWDNNGSLWRFLLRRPDDTPCQLKTSYQGIERECGGKSQIQSTCVTKFDLGKKKYGLDYFSNLDFCENVLYGDKSLYNWLRKNELIPMNMCWEGKKRDYTQIKDKLKLHQAIIEGNSQAIEELLQNGYDMDESDLDGYTPLHLAIKNNQFACFELLLEKGANINLANYKEITPLQEANQLDNKKEYTEFLLKKGARKLS